MGQLLIMHKVRVFWSFYILGCNYVIAFIHGIYALYFMIWISHNENSIMINMFSYTFRIVGENYLSCMFVISITNLSEEVSS